MIGSPTHAIVAHEQPEEVAAFLSPFGFIETARALLPAAAAQQLYGIDQDLEELRLDMPGASQGWIRVVQTPHPSQNRDPFEPRPLALDLYTRDIDSSIRLAESLGGRSHELVEYEVGDLQVREIEIECPGMVLVLLELNQRRASVLDHRPDLQHSEVHSIVWSVPSVQEALDELCGNGGLEVLADAEIRGDTISRLMNLPKDDVGVRFTLVCDAEATPARFEIIEFLDDASASTGPWLPLRTGLFGPAFKAESLERTIAALTGSSFGEVVEINSSVHRSARAVAAQGPGGFHFEVWQEDDL